MRSRCCCLRDIVRCVNINKKKACISGLAKCMKLQKDAQESFKNMKEEAEDICYDAKCQADGE